MSKRRVFTREFKVEAVALVSRQGLSVAEVARRLEVGQNLLRKWQEQFSAEGSKAFAVKAQPCRLYTTFPTRTNSRHEICARA